MLKHDPSTVADSRQSSAAEGAAAVEADAPGAKPADWPKELGGPKGPEPTRYGDWEQKGRCTDF